MAAQAEQLLRRMESNAPTDVSAVLQGLTTTALEAVTAADHAGITVGRRDGQVQSMTSTGPYPVELDCIQEQHREGPCLSAAWEHHTVSIVDLAAETRWPKYCRAALEQTPVRSVLSFQMFSDHQTMGALNFYAERPGAFDADAYETGLTMATHAALSWNLLRREEQFRSALASRDVIGQAKGLLIERFAIDAVQAFELLRRLSQETNTALSEIAERLVADRVGTNRPRV